jgi:hypothetical protein
VEIRLDLIELNELDANGYNEILQATNRRIPELEGKAFEEGFQNRYIYRFGCEEMIPNMKNANHLNSYCLAMRLGKRIPELESAIAHGKWNSETSIYDGDAEAQERVPAPAPAPAAGIQELFREEAAPEEGGSSELDTNYTEEWIRYIDRFMDMSTYKFKDRNEVIKWLDCSRNLVYNPNVVPILINSIKNLQSIDSYLKKVDHEDPHFNNLMSFMGIEVPKKKTFKDLLSSTKSPEVYSSLSVDSITPSNVTWSNTSLNGWDNSATGRISAPTKVKGPYKRNSTLMKLYSKANIKAQGEMVEAPMEEVM